MEGFEELVRHLWAAGMAAVDPGNCLPPHLPPRPAQGRLILFALGKAGATMASAACAHRHFDAGLVIAPHGTSRPDRLPQCIDFRTGAHPVPDDASLANGAAALTFISGLRCDDRLVALISGGGSAIMVAPASGISLATKQNATRTLLAAGADIADVNTVRSALSGVKGGGLWRASATRDVHVRVMSDIPGDDARYVASGPFSPDIAETARAAAIARDFGLDLAFGNVGRELDCDKGMAPRPLIVASGAQFLDAVARAARARGVGVTMLGDDLQGDARSLAETHVAAVRAHRDRRAHIWLSGGEASVRVRNDAGRGGRNLAFVLAAALAIEDLPDCAVFAADSDGIDGSSDAAGAFAFAHTPSRIRASGLDPLNLLETDRSHDAFAATAALFRTSATGVNVNDIRIVGAGFM